jgi:pilus assembly protein CpaB
MKPARLLVLAIALVAAGVAALLVMRTPEPAPVVVENIAPTPTVDVLVAGNELARGETLRADGMKWQAWPQDGRPTGAIVRSEMPNATSDLAGSLVLSGFLSGEPIRRDKLVKAEGNGFMSAILPSGMRAVAVSIDTRGANSAGGFILPNDHVDIIQTSRDNEGSKAGGSDIQVSETVLSNVRVLAIGQNIVERSGEKVATGETATLEVTASQAETLALAQKVGQLSLALRSLADAGHPERGQNDDPAGGLTVVRYGVARSVAKR